MSEQQKNKVESEKQDQILFMMLVQQHQQIAMMGLGEEPNPSSGKKEKDLKAVKYAVDTLEMLEKYTAGNLQSELANYLSETLKTLRLKYVQENTSEKG